MTSITANVAMARSRRRGFTLLELTVVLGIIALMAAAIMLFFGNASNAQKTDDAITELAAIEQAVHSAYAGQTNYVGLSNTIIAGSKQLPAKWSNGTTGLFDPFGGTVTVLPVTAAAGTSFSVSLGSMSDQACIKMATSDFGTSMVSSLIDTTAGPVGGPMTPATATTACAANPNAHTLVFGFM